MSGLGSILNSLVVINATRPLMCLPVNQKFVFFYMRRASTRFCERILVELVDNVVYLGARFYVLTDQDLDQYNYVASLGSLHIILRGTVGKTVKLELRIDREGGKFTQD